MRKEDLKVGMKVKFKEELRHVDLWMDTTNCGDALVYTDHAQLLDRVWTVKYISHYGNAQFAVHRHHELGGVPFSPDWFDEVPSGIASKADMEALYG